MKNLNEMTVTELKKMAKEMKISNWWNLKKEVLIKKIEENKKSAKPAMRMMTADEIAKLNGKKPKVEKQPELKLEGVEEIEQPKPKRGALIEYNGKAQNICAWGKELGISPNTLYGRIYKMGWSVERAFTTKK